MLFEDNLIPIYRDFFGKKPTGTEKYVGLQRHSTNIKRQNQRNIRKNLIIGFPLTKIITNVTDILAKILNIKLTIVEKKRQFSGQTNEKQKYLRKHRQKCTKTCESSNS